MSLSLTTCLFLNPAGLLVDMTKIQKLFRNIRKLTAQERNQKITKKYVLLLFTFSSLLIVSILSVVYIASADRRNSKIYVRSIARDHDQPSHQPVDPHSVKPGNVKAATENPNELKDRFMDPPDDDLDFYFGEIKHNNTRKSTCYRRVKDKCQLSPCPGKKMARSHYLGFIQDLDAAHSRKDLKNSSCSVCSVYPKQCLVSKKHRYYVTRKGRQRNCHAILETRNRRVLPGSPPLIKIKRGPRGPAAAIHRRQPVSREPDCGVQCSSSAAAAGAGSSTSTCCAPAATRSRTSSAMRSAPAPRASAARPARLAGGHALRKVGDAAGGGPWGAGTVDAGRVREAGPPGRPRHVAEAG